jgi:protocatechuate 3,4-dioxygenase beta subunit
MRSCTPTPEQEEGPYYRDLQLERSDIREGRPGALLQLEVSLVDGDCAGVPAAKVELWQCDALGRYSWYAAAGDDDWNGPAGLEPGTFLRGSQVTSQDGCCRFMTIYPGWYAGRTVHVHYKIHHPNRTLTGQLYFPDELTDEVHDSEPYRNRPRRDTRNSDDVIYREGGSVMLLVPEFGEAGYAVRATLVIESSASPSTA